MKEAVLIDLSSIAHPIWHVSQGDPDINRTSTQTVARVRAIATGHANVAVCCDSGVSFRKEIDPSYKANRPERDEALHHQIALAKEILLADGFPVWSARGFEADDLIATATSRALADPEATVLVVSSDKDLLQLVGPRVRVMRASDGEIYGEPEVVTKFGIGPEQMRDYLTLVGDASDNIKGAVGIGPKKAVEILKRFGSISSLYAMLEEEGSVGLSKAGLAPSVVDTLTTFRERYSTVRSLVEMRTDVAIPFDEITAEREAKDAATFMDAEEAKETEEAPAPAAPTGPVRVEAPPSVALAVRDSEVIEAVPVEWERQLDPRSMRDARQLASDMHASRLFSSYGTPAAVLSTVLVGRELGLPAMASLRSVHIVEGRHCLSAALMVALVLRSGMAEFFRPVVNEFGNLECNDKFATFETLRKGPGNRLIRMTYTIEEARTAGLVKDKSGWVKNPKFMLIARAESILARLVYPDLMAGLYTPEELGDMRETAVA